MQCFKSEVVNGLGIGRCCSETSSAGVVDESENLPRGLQTPSSFADGSQSGQLTAPMNPESTRTSATRHSIVRASAADGRLGGLFRPV